MKDLETIELIRVLVQLVQLCEKETHRQSGTVMFSEERQEYQSAKKVAARLIKNEYKL